MNRASNASSEGFGIEVEAELVVETEDIRDELGILRMVLEDQKSMIQSASFAIEDARRDWEQPTDTSDPHLSAEANRVLDRNLQRIKEMEGMANITAKLVSACVEVRCYFTY